MLIIKRPSSPSARWVPLGPGEGAPSSSAPAAPSGRCPPPPQAGARAPLGIREREGAPKWVWQTEIRFSHQMHLCSGSLMV